MKIEITFYDQYYNEDSTIVKEYKDIDELLYNYGFTYWRDIENGKYLNMYNKAKYHLLNEEIVHSSENGCGRNGDFGYTLENDTIMKVKILND